MHAPVWDASVWSAFQIAQQERALPSSDRNQ